MKALRFLILITIILYSCQEIAEIPPVDELPSKICSSIPTRSSNNTYEYYYWCNGVKIPLIEDANRFYVVIKSEKFENIKNSAIDAIKAIKSFDNYASLGIQPLRHTNNSSEYISFLYNISNNSQIALNEDDVVYRAPYFKTMDGYEMGITHILSVQLKTEQQLSSLHKITTECNMDFLGVSQYDSTVYYLSCTKDSKGNSLEMANLIYESGICTYAAPEFIIESIPASTPNDIYFNNQWNLLNHNHPDFDIDYVKTINSFTFSHTTNNLIVAVVDNGIYPDHEDLPTHHISYDAHTGNNISSVYGDHGTLVAGVIGATTNNNIGIAGIASGVGIMPISICYTSDGDRLNIPASTSINFANAIYFAADNGAHIINNSWEFKTASPLPNINSAIEYALEKGCIVVFASGNDNSIVSQPASSAHSETLVVGATNQNGTRSYYSNYGQSIDVVAPGSSIWTTTWNGDYQMASGTSLAAPHIAATAALILSVNPDLTRQEVTDIIERTAHKLPSYTFSETPSRPNGTWNNEVGYGLVNCYDAVSMAYYNNADNYLNLVEFDFPEFILDMRITAEDDIAIIWDWETKDITYINASASEPKDTTISHIFRKTGMKHIVIAETLAPGETPTVASDALTELDIFAGNQSNNFDIKDINQALKYVRITCGLTPEPQSIAIKDLPALKDLYLVNMGNCNVTVDNCPSLLRFGSSRYIWGAPEIHIPKPTFPLEDYTEDALEPDVVNPDPLPQAWPDIPERTQSFNLLNITDCENLTEVSLENVKILQFDCSNFPKLRYLYISSQDGKIVGGAHNSTTIASKGQYLAETVATLPQKTFLTKGKILIRCVNATNTAYDEAIIAPRYKTLIEDTARDRNWTVVWDSGVR